MIRTVFLTCILVVFMQDVYSFPWNFKDNNEKTYDSLHHAVNGFGMEIFRKLNLNAGDQNLVFSPMSISSIMLVAENGAKAETHKAMKRALHLTGFPDSHVNHCFKECIQQFQQKDDKVEIRLSNSVWYDNNFELSRDFLKLNHLYFGAKIAYLDFSDPGSAGTINNWVSGQTNGKIEKIIDHISPGAMLYLINAIYFNGKWEVPFDPEQTGSLLFSSGKEEKKVPAMQATRESRLYKGSDYNVLSLPYAGNAYHLSILLPHKDADLDEIISGLSVDSWQKIKTGLKKAKTDLKLPKFKFDFSGELKPVLSDMGMEVAFDKNKADFSNISLNDKLYISNVLHKAFIDVNEAGTEAAAATSVEFKSVSAGQEPVEPFYVDRPFLFVLRNLETGLFLFMGRVNMPAY